MKGYFLYQFSAMLFLISMGFISPLSAQIDKAERYKIGYDEEKKLSFLFDKELIVRYDLPVQYPRRIARIKHNSFVQVSSSDMYCLFDMQGNKLMRESRRFIFDLEDSLVFASEMYTGQWFILNFNGDTLSYAKYPSFRYKPSLDTNINLVESIDWDQISRPKKRFGFLNKKGEWLLRPIATQNPIISENEIIIQAFGNEYKIKVDELESKMFDQVLTEKSLLDNGAVKIPMQMVQHEFTLQSKPIAKDTSLKVRNAEFPGGEEKLAEIYQKHFNLRFNKIKEKRKVAVVEVTINSKGYLKEYQFIRKVEDELDGELIRVLKLHRQWIPAIIIDEEPPDEPNTTNLIYSSQKIWIIMMINSEEKWGIIFHRKDLQ